MLSKDRYNNFFYTLIKFIKKTIKIAMIIYLIYGICMIIVICSSIKDVNDTFSEALHAENGLINGSGTEEERLERYNNAVKIYKAECDRYHILCDEHPVASSIAESLNSGLVSDDLYFMER